MKVRVYWNLHKKVWSIQHKGKVIARLSVLYLRNCNFTVQPGGRARVLREKQKNIHAFVDGEIDDRVFGGVDVGDMLRYGNMVSVTYNPYKYDTFVVRDSETEIFHADLVVLTRTYRTDTGHHPAVYASNPALKVALEEYGAWHLPTLKEEYERIHAELIRVNPDGGLAWGILARMKLAIDAREAPEGALVHRTLKHGARLVGC
jgi:hypothetical protein